MTELDQAVCCQQVRYQAGDAREALARKQTHIQLRRTNLSATAWTSKAWTDGASLQLSSVLAAAAADLARTLASLSLQPAGGPA